MRWVPAAALKAPLADATWLDVILYSKQQIVAECRSMGEAEDTSALDYEWGIISIKAMLPSVWRLCFLSSPTLPMPC